MGLIVFKNCSVVDASSPEPREGYHVLVEGDRIAEVSDRPIKTSVATEIDVDGRTLMPGLIDAHAHVTETKTSSSEMEAMPITLFTALAARVMKEMLDRGFTTVRDAGGADWGIAEAVESGLLAGPRLFISGRPLTQTGGHGDHRRRTASEEPVSSSSALALTACIADGVPEVRQAAREELRKGADQIKVMASGGVLSHAGSIANTQYSVEELTAIVEEAAAWGTYVLAHTYTAEAVTRAVQCGVRSIEHANLIDLQTAELMAAKGAFMVPTLVPFGVMDREGKEFGISEDRLQKVKQILEAGLSSIEFCKKAGVRMGFGTDLFGELHKYQSLEFSVRAEVLSPHEIITQATATNAALIRREGDLGVIAPGALADVLVVDGDPLGDLTLLQEQGAHLSVIMKEGRFHKNRLAA